MWRQRVSSLAEIEGGYLQLGLVTPSDRSCVFLIITLPYVRRHITVNKNVLRASLNKTFPSFLPCCISPDLQYY